MKHVVVALVVAACGPRAAAPLSPAPPAPTASPAPTTEAEPAGPAPASQEETLAAIQKAMNELDEGVQQCWAARAARERFDLEGEYKARIDIGAGTPTTATLTTDTVRNAGLATCVVTLLTAYRWAPPLAGQSIELPFRVRAPRDGQNVIDRRLVPFQGQGKVAVAVLLDDANTGNDAASMFEVAIGAGGTTGLRVAPREELWYFLGPATVVHADRTRVDVAAGTMMAVPATGVREVAAGAVDMHAVVVAFPGGREGAGRVGALDTPLFDGTRKAPAKPTIVTPAQAAVHGPATIYVDSARGSKTFAAEILTLAAGAVVAEHVHATETELLYLLEGEGTMTVNGVALAVSATSVVQVPPGTKHTFTATTALRAVQLYTPGGPEQRFKAK